MSDSFPPHIGNFRILSKLGQGGMGNVYRAVHGTLERPVALKVLPPEFSSHPEYVTRFLREARTIAAIRHENIIQIYDSGEFNGQYYIAMELIEGGSLLTIADARKKVAEEEGLKMMLQAARGLNAAHAKGLVHRDIKPENLLLGNDGVLRIVDFGLVMDSGSATQLTLAGTCLGTPMYMSPEQADGEICDARSDLYSLGASFFRILTGRPPFGSATVMNILFKQKFEKPPDPQSLRPDLSRGASDLLLHLLSKPRGDRPDGAPAVIAMIEDVLAGKPIPAPPPFVPLAPKQKPDGSSDEEPRVSSDGETAVLFGSNPRHDSGAHSKRGKSSLVAAAIVFVVCAGLIYAIASSTKSDPPPRPPVPAAAIPEKEAAPRIAEDELRERVSYGDAAFSAGRFKDARAIYADALTLAPDNVELIARRDRADRRIVFERFMLEADALEKAGKLEDAQARFQNAEALDEGDVAKAAGKRVAAAIEAAKKPRVEFSPAPPRDEKAEKLAGLEKLAGEAREKNEFEKAEAAYVQAAELAGDARKGDFQESARQCRRMIFLNQAKAAETRGDLAGAETAYLAALKLVNDEATAKSLDSVREKLKKNADEKAEADYKEAMSAGDAAMSKGDFAMARVQFGMARRSRPDVSPPEAKLNEVDARELLAKGDAARTNGDLDEARKFYESANAKSSALESEAQSRIKSLDNSPTRAAKAIAKAAERAADGKSEEAAAILDEALKADEANALLKDAKAALDAARAAEDVIDKLQKIEAAALLELKTGSDLDADDAATKRHTQAIAKFQQSDKEKAKKPTAAFAARDFTAAMTALASARVEAADLGAELQKAVEHYAKQAEREVGMKVPFIPKIAVGGDKKKRRNTAAFRNRLSNW